MTRNTINVKINSLFWLKLAAMITFICQGNCCCNNSKCILTKTKAQKTVYNCYNVCLNNVSLANVPSQTNILYMRNCELQAFPILKLKQLEILDLAYNNIKQLLNNTFENFTTLVELDIRYNNIEWNSSAVRNIFSCLSRLKVMKLSGPFHNADTLCHHISCPVSVQDVHIDNDNVDNALLIAAQFTNVTTLTIFCNLKLNTDIVLRRNHSVLLHRLTQLKMLSLIKCQIYDVEKNFFQNMLHLTTLNMACNKLQIPQIIRQFGSDNGLSKLDTLVLDKNLNENPIVNLTLNSLGNLSFSSTLRRISLQGIGKIIYYPPFWTGASNLLSVSFGHNLIIHCLPINACNFTNAIYNLSHVQHLKLAFLNDIYPEMYPICHMPDITVDEFFEDNTLLEDTTNSNCSMPSDYSLDLKKCALSCYLRKGCELLLFPYCLRTLFIDHLVYSQWKTDRKDYTFQVCTNSVEEIIASNMIMGRDGWSFNKMQINGFRKLRKLDLHSTGLHFFEKITVDSDQLEHLDLSQNFLADMNKTVLKSCFGNVFPALKFLNFTHCYLEELPSQFLQKFPNLSILDLSCNRLKNFTVYVKQITSNLTINITSNYLKSFSDEYMLELDEQNSRYGITLVLYDNDFECTCSTLSFIRWFQTTKVTIVDKEKITCTPDNVLISEFDAKSLQFKCNAFRRNLITSISVVPSLTIFTFILIYVVFNYRWHLRWYIFLIKQHKSKRKSCASKKQHGITFSKICFVSHLGVKTTWIKDEILNTIENTWNLGKVFFMDRDAKVGEDMSEVILNAIQHSANLVFIVGNELSNKNQIFWFEFALSMSNVWRQKDIIIVLKDSVFYEDMQCKLLRSFCHPRCSITKLQLVNNKIFWNEFKQLCQENKEKDDEEFYERQPLLNAS